MTKWISAKEKLPPQNPEDKDYSIYVLITDGNNVGIGWIFYPGKQEEDLTWYEATDFISSENSLEFEKITHWAKLPKLPKKLV